jgi:3-oxoacyl-[acyl-carrier-protein] synthase-3
MTNSIITATGSYIPSSVVPNEHFLENEFYNSDGIKLEKPNPEIIQKLYEITGIKERRHVSDEMTTSDMAHIAAERALKDIDKESLDYIILAQNFGDVNAGCNYSDTVPTLAARVKHKLRIQNPFTVAFDLPFGCPGWLQGVILADCYIKSGHAKRILVIGAEILSRVSDPHDVDSMIYADGAGAVVIEATDQDVGILSHVSRSDTYDHAFLLNTGSSYNPRYEENKIFIKMNGHDIYRYALKTVPATVKMSLDRAGLDLHDVKKILIHQANAKMDEAILKRLFNLYNSRDIPHDIMPMMICWAGNSSVATLPTLLDLIQRGKLGNHRLSSGDNTVFASVGAGMNINSMVYRMP